VVEGEDLEEKGYSGAAVYCRKERQWAPRGFGFAMADSEGH